MSATTESATVAANSGEASSFAGVDAPTDARKQVEFYLSDSNLPFDKYMWTLYSKRTDHYIPIKTIASFKRMRQYSEYGHQWLVDTLRKSESLEVDPSGELVRRTTEPKETTIADAFERSVYAKGFDDETPDLQVRLEQFFENYGQINAVRMRREQDSQKFKGSVFCEFDSMGGVKSFLDAAPKPTWDGKELLIMSKGDYVKMKCAEKGIKHDTERDREEKHGSGKTSKRSGVGAPKFNAFRLKNPILPTDDTEELKPHKDYPILGQTVRAHRVLEGSKSVWKIVDENDITFTPHCIVKFTASSGAFKRNDLKDKVKEAQGEGGLKPFTEYEGSEGHLFFSRALTDAQLDALNSNAGKVGEVEVQYEWVDEGEEQVLQKQHILNSIERQGEQGFFDPKQEKGSSARHGKFGKGSRGGRGGGRGGRGGANKSGPKPASNTAKPTSKKEDKDSEIELDPKGNAKRKRDQLEPDGAIGTGDREGGGPPAIAHTAKKAKVE